MAAIRFSTEQHEDLVDHLFAGPGERFAFALCSTSMSSTGPVFVVDDIEFIAPRDVTVGRDGWSLSDRALDHVLNRALRESKALVEAHNHSTGPPAFSSIDRDGLRHFSAYMLETVIGQPYGATVWAGTDMAGEWFAVVDGESTHGVIESATAVGQGVRSLAHIHDARDRDVFDRQIPLLGAAGHETLRRLRVGIVGLSGTGSHVVQGLAHAGVRRHLLVDHDMVDGTNLHRVVTADHADVDTPKVITARRVIRAIAPDADVEVVYEPLLEHGNAAEALQGVDIIFGCVDNDGPRLLLNRIAIAGRIPYVDVATGIIAPDGAVKAMGGRVALTLPGGPCLVCTEELDVEEVRAYFLTPEERRAQIALGYVDGEGPAPSVISLNGVIAHAAINELVCWIAGLRDPAARLDLDVLGGKPAGQRLLPRRGVRRRPACPECGASS